MRPSVTPGDIIQTKKPHPCGTNSWKVIRSGMDIKLRCIHCERIVMLTYEDFAKRYKRTIHRSEESLPSL